MNYEWFIDEWMTTGKAKKELEYFGKKLTPAPMKRIKSLLVSAYEEGFHDGWQGLIDDESELMTHAGEIMAEWEGQAREEERQEALFQESVKYNTLGK